MNSKNELNIVLEYLIHENFADSHTGALKILEVMSDDWMNSILSENMSDTEMRRRAEDAEKYRAQRAAARSRRNSTAPTRYYGPNGVIVLPGSRKGKRGFFDPKGNLVSDNEVSTTRP